VLSSAVSTDVFSSAKVNAKALTNRTKPRIYTREWCG
jgi:hypothetical protein